MASCYDCIHFNPCNSHKEIILEKPTEGNDWRLHNKVENECRHFKPTVEQIKWERDKAIKQLESYGVGFGEQADVAKVKHGEWELKSEIHTLFEDVDEEFYVECPFCHRTEWIPFEFEEEKMLEYVRKHFPYCHCGAKMDGKEQ